MSIEFDTRPYKYVIINKFHNKIEAVFEDSDLAKHALEALNDFKLDSITREEYIKLLNTSLTSANQ